MSDQFKPKLAPTIVEGVVQFRISVDDADLVVLQDSYLKQLKLTDNELARQWIDYSSTGLWSKAQVRQMQRVSKLYQAGVVYDSLNIDIESFLRTSIALHLIDQRELMMLREVWRVRRRGDFFEAQDNFALKQNFWGIHYIDHHLGLLRYAAERGLVTNELRDEISTALLQLTPANLQLPQLRAAFDAAAKDPSLYGRIQKDSQSVYLPVSGEFINVYEEDSVQAGIASLAKKGLYLAPGFELSPLSDLRLIGLSDLVALNHPEITVEALMAITSFGGDIGKGNIIKTHSLFPGEKAVLTIESYSKESSSYSLTSSVLDSTSVEAEESLAREVGATQSWNEESSRASSFSVGVEAKASWGMGSAGGSANYSGSASETSKRAGLYAVSCGT